MSFQKYTFFPYGEELQDLQLFFRFIAGKNRAWLWLSVRGIVSFSLLRFPKFPIGRPEYIGDFNLCFWGEENLVSDQHVTRWQLARHSLAVRTSLAAS